MPSDDPMDGAHVQLALTLANQLVFARRIDDALVQYRLAATAFKARGEPQHALSVYLIMGSLAPCCTRTQVECADHYAAVGLTADAVAIYEWAAQVYTSAAMPGAAAWVLTRAVQADPTAAERRIRLADLCLQIGRPRDAVNALHGAAQTFFAQANTDAYVWVAERILGLDAAHLPTLRDLTRVRLFQRDVVRVSANLRALFRVAPQDEIGGELLAETLAMLGRPRDAARVAKLVAKQRRRRQSPAWRDDARRIVDRALQWVPNSADLLRLRAGIDQDTRIQSLRDGANQTNTTGVVEFVSDAVMLSGIAAGGGNDFDDDRPTGVQPSRRRDDDVTRREAGHNIVPFRRSS